VVTAAGRVYRAPPATLSWAAEFEPGSPTEGKATLAALVKAGHGVERLAMAGLFREALASEGAVPLSSPLVALAAGLLVVEVVARRWWAGSSPARTKRPVVAAPTVEVAKPVEPVVDGVSEALREARARSRGRTKRS
jgi:hypothetical protein